jgi:ribonuclease-3
MAADQSDLEQNIGYHFNDGRLLTIALTHASYIAERGGIGNDRLEFIGDAVIGVAVAQMLYEHHPERNEGWLTQMRSRLVDKECLAFKARDLNVGDFLILGKGEEKRGGAGKSSILSGAYEALMGAVFIDAGYDACKAVIERHFSEIEGLGEDIYPKNYKSLLQERLQKDGMGLPRYEVAEISGPDHERVFSVSVLIDGEEWGRGLGRNKREAEQLAARGALER